METTILYTGVLGIIFFIHSLRTINARRTTKTSLGDGGDDLMLRRIRTHGNFAEYIPIVLIILLLLEQQEVNYVLLHMYGVVVVVGRLLHAYGLHSPETPGWARMLGMQFTLWPLIVGSISLLVLYAV